MSTPEKKDNSNNTPILRSRVNSKQAVADRQRAAQDVGSQDGKVLRVIKTYKVHIAAAAAGLLLTAVVVGSLVYNREKISTKIAEWRGPSSKPSK